MQHSWYEVRAAGGVNNFVTLAEAKDHLNQMSLGYPENEKMSDENREYWKKAALDAGIFQIWKFEERV